MFILCRFVCVMTQTSVVSQSWFCIISLLTGNRCSCLNHTEMRFTETGAVGHWVFFSVCLVVSDSLWRCDDLQMCFWCFCMRPHSSWSVHRSPDSFTAGGNPSTSYWFKEIPPGDWLCGAFRKHLPYRCSHPLKVRDSALPPSVHSTT